MRSTMIAGIAAVALAVSTTTCLADGPAVAANADEIAQALRGKICTTTVGAKFAFGLDGRYLYDGLWRNGGAYVIGHGVVTVTSDSGLERSFAMSRHGDALYIEETRLHCRPVGPPRS